ncbi:Ail/Lom family outer membrane beta-barrel protein [Escherichia coli]|nr:Ail/Lom family outer membrane beta-barrel protein [Escherichia coli]EKY6647269.1 Ail/Lom family outer membrane beta-barrel protein [Escherichia coli]ELO5043369.1 Ail/Lom family outer membrane beta-barrel protein [Escherichia coli]ELO5138830.1 Ail/Lom family outer membrane beta-barrel protein [Escherichia coli]ELP4013747.1 Ail/Lom family outer membrane beta-barrel protein [Escherichia coli]
MKKTILSSLFLSIFTLASVPAAQADTHSVSLGYAQSRIEHFKDIRGVNLKYRYEAEAPVGVMTSFSWESGKDDKSGNLSGDASWRSSVKTKYWSLLAGPSLRVNDSVSLYALAGAGTARVDVNDRIHMAGYREESSDSHRRTGFAWGAGVQFNPMENVVIDVGYEGSKIDAMKVNGVNLGVGYRF